MTKENDIRESSQYLSSLYAEKPVELTKQQVVIRNRFKRAAAKALMIVSTLGCVTDAERVTVRFDPESQSEIPKVVKLKSLKADVIKNVRFACKAEYERFEKIALADSGMFDKMLKDMFWYIVSSHFQANRRPEEEEGFLNRVAISYKSFFFKMKSVSLYGECLKKFPDILAQLIYFCALAAFPQTRRKINHTFKLFLISKCYELFAGFEPRNPTTAHWLPEVVAAVNANSSHKVKAEIIKSEFPASRNKLKCSERLEKIRKFENKKYVARIQGDRRREAEIEMEGIIPKAEVAIKTHERNLFSVGNSPMFERYLKMRHLDQSLETKALALKVRLTDDENNPLDSQGSLVKSSKYSYRRHRALDAVAHRDLLEKFEKFNNGVQKRHLSQRSKFNGKNRREHQKLNRVTNHIDSTRNHILKKDSRAHDVSNVLVRNRKANELNKRSIYGNYRPHPPLSRRYIE